MNKWLLLTPALAQQLASNPCPTFPKELFYFLAFTVSLSWTFKKFTEAAEATGRVVHNGSQILAISNSPFVQPQFSG